MLADQCADPGIFAKGVQARLPENSSDNVFFSFFFLNFTVLQWVIKGFGGVQHIQDGPTFSRGGGVNFFQGDWGSKC